MDTNRRNIYLDDENWEDLKQLAKLMGTTRPKVIRETLEQTVWTLKKAFGGELEPSKVDRVNFYRNMLLETTNLIKEIKEDKGKAGGSLG